MDDQVDSVEVAIELESLIAVEGETLDEVTAMNGFLLLLFDFGQLVGNPAGDEVVGFSCEGGCDQIVEGKDPEWDCLYFERKESELAAAE